MSERTVPDMGVTLAGAAMAAVAAALFCVVLSSLAKPDHFKARLAGLDRMAARIDAIAAKPGDPSAYPPGAVCGDAPGRAGEILKQRLASLASVGGVAVTNVAVDAGDGAGGELTPVKLHFEASGAYDSVLLLVDTLGKSQPQLFVDTADLKPATSTVDLKLAGYIYCWTSDHR